MKRVKEELSTEWKVGLGDTVMLLFKKSGNSQCNCLGHMMAVKS